MSLAFFPNSLVRARPIPEPISSVGLPDWVTAPEIEGGFADTQCVQASASMGILKNKVGVFLRALKKVTDVTVLANPKAKMVSLLYVFSCVW